MYCACVFGLLFLCQPISMVVLLRLPALSRFPSYYSLVHILPFSLIIARSRNIYILIWFPLYVFKSRSVSYLRVWFSTLILISSFFRSVADCVFRILAVIRRVILIFSWHIIPLLSVVSCINYDINLYSIVTSTRSIKCC